MTSACGSPLAYTRCTAAQHSATFASMPSVPAAKSAGPREEEERVRRRHGGYSRTRTAVPILLNEVKRWRTSVRCRSVSDCAAGTAEVAQPLELWLFDDAPILGGAEVSRPPPARSLVSVVPPSLGSSAQRSTEMAHRCAAAGIAHVAATFPPLLPHSAPRWPGGVLRTRLLLERAGSEGDRDRKHGQGPGLRQCSRAYLSPSPADRPADPRPSTQSDVAAVALPSGEWAPWLPWAAT